MSANQVILQLLPEHAAAPGIVSGYYRSYFYTQAHADSAMKRINKKSLCYQSHISNISDVSQHCIMSWKGCEHELCYYQDNYGMLTVKTPIKMLLMCWESVWGAALYCTVLYCAVQFCL